MKRSVTSLPAAGVSALLTMFAVLCLVTFTLLSISTAQAHKALSQAAADSVSAYYQADARAEAILTALRRGDVPQEVTRKGDLFTYTCPISDSQALYVAVRITGETYTVLQWQAAAADQAREEQP